MGALVDTLKVVILCGGKGTRSYPFTDYFPKVMMPIDGSPILVHLMRIYAQQGFKNFVLAVGYRKEILYDYFAGRFPEWSIEIVDTGSESDTGERVFKCKDFVGDTFFATYGDGLGNVNLHELLVQHRSHSGLATMTSVPLRSQYGLVHFGTDGRVNLFEEKPIIADYWINAGFFVFNKKCFEEWSGNNLETDILPHLATQNSLYTYRHYGFWKSMDTSKDQQELEKIFAKQGAVWAKIGNNDGNP